MSAPHIDTISRPALMQKRHNELQSPCRSGNRPQRRLQLQHSPIEGCGTVSLVISDSYELLMTSGDAPFGSRCVAGNKVGSRCGLTFDEAQGDAAAPHRFARRFFGAAPLPGFRDAAHALRFGE